MEKNSLIYIAGHEGLVGSAFVRHLESKGYKKIITRSHSELDLIEQSAARYFFENEKPEYIILAAAKVGGIHANSTYPAEFIRDNLAIQSNVIHEAWRAGVKRLLFLGSSCIYPRNCKQPIKEEYLLTDTLEPTNRPYAVAKIAGIEMCWSYNRQYGTQYLAVMPNNLYGPGDNFDLEKSHVIPAIMRKMHEAKRSENSQVDIWGTGAPLREFLYSDDMVDASLYLLNMPDEKYASLLTTDFSPMVNIGSGEELTIRELAELIKNVVGFAGELVFDTSKPDGTPRKLVDISRLKALGWNPKTELRDGLERMYRWFLENESVFRR